MSTDRIQLQSQGIKRVLKRYKLYDAAAEYIWNSFDAQATKTEIIFERNILGAIEKITVRDNGCGIDMEELPEKFRPIFLSKKYNSNKANTSKYHGKNGIGRLTFFTFASHAEWTTVYRRNGKLFRYSINIDAERLEVYTVSKREITEAQPGTTVVFTNISPKFSAEDFISYLETEFSWYIELKSLQGCGLYIDNMLFDCKDVIAEKSVHEYSYNGIDFMVIFCRWKKKLNKEFSKFYYIDSFGEEVFKENTTLNNKSDDFFHSVYIKSSLFDQFYFDAEPEQITLESYTKSSPEFKFIKNEVEKLLIEKRAPFVKQNTEKLLTELRINKAYPPLGYSPEDNARRERLDNLISALYYAEPRIFTKQSILQQKLLVRMLDSTLESRRLEQLIDIIDGIVELTPSEKRELEKLI